MGFLERSSTVVPTGRMRASADGDPFSGMYRGFFPSEWMSSYSAAGISVTPELAMTLSTYYSGLTRISGDFMRMPAHIKRVHSDGTKDRVRGGPTSGGIGALAYRLRWKPNVVQTAAAFFACLVAQYVNRSRAYAEIWPDESGAIGQLLPRHPDRVLEKRLPSGRLLFEVTDKLGEKPRAVTQEEMLFVHDTTAGGFQHISRVQYGTQALGTTLAAEYAAARFFKSGMNAAVVATHPGALLEADKVQLHSDLTRFGAGKENNFGVLLLEEDIKITALGLDPEKAQMMAARNFGVREVARLLHMPPELLFADNTGVQTGKSWEEIQNVYHTGCLGTIVTALEQAMQDALILNKEMFILEFLMDALFRGDLKSRAEYYQSALEGPWMWPSEIREKEGMNADAELDAIAEKRYRPGEPKGSQPPPATRSERRQRERDREDEEEARGSARGQHRYHLLLHDNAVRVLRRERADVLRLAKKHANNPDAWGAELREFYGEHARFVAETMRMDILSARAYCAEHGTALLAHGIPMMDEQWERTEAEELAALALDDRALAA